MSDKYTSFWIFAFLFTATVCIFCFFSFCYKIFSTEKNNYATINELNKEVIYLRDMTYHASELNRFTNNLLITNYEEGELKFNKTQIEANRQELIADLAKGDRMNISEAPMKDSLLQLGKTYLVKNQMLIEIINKNDLVGGLDFKIKNTRPLITNFLHLNQKLSDILSENIIHVTSSSKSYFSYYEFWVLIICLIPLILVYLKLGFVVVQGLWFIFSTNKSYRSGSHFI